MVITWFGLSCFKVTSGVLTLVTDPFSRSVGLAPPRLRADIVVTSNLQNDAYNNHEGLGGDSKFVIDGPGEFDVKGLFVHGIPAEAAAIYAIRMEDIRLGFLGSLKQKELTDSQLEDLGEIDILFVPVGGGVVCDAESAVKIVNQIEPHLVVPMHYAQKGLRFSLDKVEQFLKEIGSTKIAPQEKLTVKKQNFQTESSTTAVVVLLPTR